MTKKTTPARKIRIALKKETLTRLSDHMLESAMGGLMNQTPRTDCICHSQCATNAC